MLACTGDVAVPLCPAAVVAGCPLVVLAVALAGGTAGEPGDGTLEVTPPSPVAAPVPVPTVVGVPIALGWVDPRPGLVAVPAGGANDEPPPPSVGVPTEAAPVPVSGDVEAPTVGAAVV
jgi:hypothetical protein